MARVVVLHPPDAAERILVPRDDALVREHDEGGGRYRMDDGPFRSYERTVTTRDDGQLEEHVDFRVATRFWGLLFVPPLRRAFAAHDRDHMPWWAPPQRLDERAASILGLLLTVSIVGGYLGTLITQTLTYVGDEFGTDIGGQKNVLSAVRASIVLLVPLAALADRLGRRRLISLTAGLGCVATATGAFVPSLLGYGISQTVARGFASALIVLIAILSAEEMPAGSRAWSYSLIALTQGLGAGICVWFLPFADDSARAWRALYLLPLLMLPLVLIVARTLPESRRFVATHVDAPIAGHGRRFALLAVSGFLLAVYATPSSQLGNEFLNDARGFSASRVALFTVLTVTPATIGVIVGGKLADVRGRRVVGAVGIVGGTLLSVATYASAGWTMWVASTMSSVIAGAVVPALGVYRPELFPTSLRGRAGGVLEGVQVLGAVAGLQLVGGLVDAGHSYSSAFGVAAIAPMAVAVLILVAFPETAHRSLEELNPEDRSPAPSRETG
ncbi:MAG: MFS transporter [Actinomycetota bacterium]|nr:MFS transporter [Acidimicrobiia bacterium]MDQ3293993.1 MFS transporter [Actinomycetota bacterium]